MDEKIINMIEALGAEGVDAFYFYVIAGKIEMAVFLGLCTWGTRSAWKVIKKEFE